MPRELTRQSFRQEAAGRHLEIEVKEKDRTVWVALSGILDRQGVEQMIALTAQRLPGRGLKVVLDGSRLTHLDYRATAALVRWNRSLRLYRHQLYLQNWSDYLKAILCMEDWDRELEAGAAGVESWRVLGDALVGSMP